MALLELGYLGFAWEDGTTVNPTGDCLMFYVQKVLCSENIVQKVLCSEGPIFRRSHVQKNICLM